jgi:arsenate reductase
MPVTIYHNPHCSKSRATLALLKERGIEPTIVEYLTSPPDVATLTEILKKLRIAPRDLLRKGEAEYKTLHLDDPTLADDQIVAAMVSHPILIERPIVVKGAKAAIGRPPEGVLGIL